MNNVLAISGLTKKYGKKQILKNINMTIPKGEIYGFIGENGAGKTTLIRIVAGVIKENSGEVSLFGSQGKAISIERQRIGVLIEAPALFPKLTARKNLDIIRLQRGIPGTECIEKTLKLVGLQEVMNERVENFSLGMKQRLGIAIAILGDPEFLILDEPTNGLDPIGIIEVRDLLKKLHVERGITILISSHILSELDQLATYYGIIHHGEILEELSTEELAKKCQKALEIQVTDVSKAVHLIETELMTTNYCVLDNKMIKLYDYIDDPGLVNQILSQNGVIVHRLTNVGDELEGYYMQVLGGKSHA